MLNQMLNKNSQLRATSLSVSGRLGDTITEIRLILHAIELRAPEEAWKACVDHVRKAGEIAVSILREREKSVNGSDKRKSLRQTDTPSHNEVTALQHVSQLDQKV